MIIEIFHGTFKVSVSEIVQTVNTVCFEIHLFWKFIVVFCKGRSFSKLTTFALEKVEEEREFAEK